MEAQRLIEMRALQHRHAQHILLIARQHPLTTISAGALRAGWARLHQRRKGGVSASASASAEPPQRSEAGGQRDQAAAGEKAKNRHRGFLASEPQALADSG
jgi:hypothetical protein